MSEVGRKILSDDVDQNLQKYSFATMTVLRTRFIGAMKTLMNVCRSFIDLKSPLERTYP